LHALLAVQRHQLVAEKDVKRIEGTSPWEIERHALDGAYGTQELNKLVTDLGRGFVAITHSRLPRGGGR
jgi:hypothetical protein